MSDIVLCVSELLALTNRRVIGLNYVRGGSRRKVLEFPSGCLTGALWVFVVALMTEISPRTESSPDKRIEDITVGGIVSGNFQLPYRQAS